MAAKKPNPMFRKIPEKRGDASCRIARTVAAKSIFMPMKPKEGWCAVDQGGNLMVAFEQRWWLFLHTMAESGIPGRLLRIAKVRLTEVK